MAKLPGHPAESFLKWASYEIPDDHTISGQIDVAAIHNL